MAGADVIVHEQFKIYVRYLDWGVLDDEEYVVEERWLAARRKGDSDNYNYSFRSEMGWAHDWVDRYDGDLHMAMDMATKLAQIVKIGRRLIEENWTWELVLIHDKTHRTVTPLNEANAMVVLAVAAL